MYVFFYLSAVHTIEIGKNGPLSLLQSLRCLSYHGALADELVNQVFAGTSFNKIKEEIQKAS